MFAFRWSSCGRKPEYPEETHLSDFATKWPSHMPTLGIELGSQRWEARELPIPQPDSRGFCYAFHWVCFNFAVMENKQNKRVDLCFIDYDMYVWVDFLVTCSSDLTSQKFTTNNVCCNYIVGLFANIWYTWHFSWYFQVYVRSVKESSKD